MAVVERILDYTETHFLRFSSAPGVMDGALPAMGAGGISNTSTRSPPPPVSGGPKLFVKGFETIVSVPRRSETKYFGKCQNLTLKKCFSSGMTAYWLLVIRSELQR